MIYTMIVIFIKLRMQGIKGIFIEEWNLTIIL